MTQHEQSNCQPIQDEAGEHRAKREVPGEVQCNITAVELTKGDHIFFSPGLTGIERSDAELSKIEEEEEDRNKAILLLKNLDDNRFGTLAAKLKESFFLERDEYPTTISSMFKIMAKCNHSNRQSSQAQNRPNNHPRRQGVVFTQQGTQDNLPPSDQRDLVLGTDGRTFNVRCYNCDKWGHYASSCSEEQRRVGFSSLMCRCAFTHIFI